MEGARDRIRNRMKMHIQGMMMSGNNQPVMSSSIQVVTRVERPNPQASRELEDFNKAMIKMAVTPPKDETVKTLYLRLLNPSIHDQQLRDCFSRFGEIESILHFVRSGVSCAYLTYTSRQAAEKAMVELATVFYINDQKFQVLWGSNGTPITDEDLAKEYGDSYPFRPRPELCRDWGIRDREEEEKMDRKGKGKQIDGADSCTGGGKKRKGVEFRDEGLRTTKRKTPGVLQLEEDDDRLGFLNDMEEDEPVVEGTGNGDQGSKSNSSYVFPKEEEINEDEFDRIMEERYKPGSGFVRFAGDDVKDSIEMDALVPTAKDPPIWKVKCTIGRERHSVLCLMHKFVELRKIGTKLEIFSAFSVEHVKGYIFIEAEKEHGILEACKGLTGIYATRMVLLPKAEAPNLLSVERKSKKTTHGKWALVKSGRYKRDLAQVVAVSDSQRKSLIKLIPRMDVQALAQKYGGGVSVQKGLTPAPRLISSSELKNSWGSKPTSDASQQAVRDDNNTSTWGNETAGDKPVSDGDQPGGWNSWDKKPAPEAVAVGSWGDASASKVEASSWGKQVTSTSNVEDSASWSKHGGSSDGNKQEDSRWGKLVADSESSQKKGEISWGKKGESESGWGNKDGNSGTSNKEGVSWGQPDRGSDRSIGGSAWGNQGGGFGSGEKKDNSSGWNKSEKDDNVPGWVKQAEGGSSRIEPDGGSSWSKPDGGATWGKEDDGGSSWGKKDDGGSAWGQKNDGDTNKEDGGSAWGQKNDGNTNKDDGGSAWGKPGGGSSWGKPDTGGGGSSWGKQDSGGGGSSWGKQDTGGGCSSWGKPKVSEDSSPWSKPGGGSSFKCGESGHMARDCSQGGGGGGRGGVRDRIRNLMKMHFQGMMMSGNNQPVMSSSIVVTRVERPNPQASRELEDFNKAMIKMAVTPPKDETVKTLYLRLLNPSIHDQQLRDCFSRFGEIESILHFVRSGLSCAYLTYTSRQAAEKAMVELATVFYINDQKFQVLWGSNGTPITDEDLAKVYGDSYPFRPRPELRDDQDGFESA